jgi:AcrR family transcriptional regulator
VDAKDGRGVTAAAEGPGAAVEARRRGPRGPYAAGREAQRAIVDAARAVFAERGYRAGSLRDVGERAGVSAANVLHHFGSKEGLLVAVLEAREESTGPELLERFRRGEVVSALRELVRANALDRDVLRLYTILGVEATDPDHPAHDHFHTRYSDIRAYLSSAVERARQVGALPPGPDAALVAAGLVAVMDGLQTQWLLDESFDMTAAFDAYLLSIGARLDTPI